MTERKKPSQKFKYRLIFSIVRNSGLGHAALVFLACFLICAAIVAFVEPGVDSYFDAIWFCFQAVTTIGFGDILIVTPLARISTMIMSVFGIFCVAVMTGAVVSYCNEIARIHYDESLVHFVDKLEHLSEMSPEELDALSAKVRERRRR